VAQIRKSLRVELNVNLRTFTKKHLRASQKNAGPDHGNSKFGNSGKQFPVMAFSTFCVGHHFCMSFIGLFYRFCQLPFYALRFEFRAFFHSSVTPFFIYALFGFMLRLFFSFIVLRFISVLFSREELRSGNDNQGPQCNYAALC
jgi:hypothetical protein